MLYHIQFDVTPPIAFDELDATKIKSKCVYNFQYLSNINKMTNGK